MRIGPADPRDPLPSELVDLWTDQRRQLMSQSQLEDVISERWIPGQDWAVRIGADHCTGDRALSAVITVANPNFNSGKRWAIREAAPARRPASAAAVRRAVDADMG
jgi:hypothetical protein